LISKEKFNDYINELEDKCKVEVKKWELEPNFVPSKGCKCSTCVDPDGTWNIETDKGVINIQHLKMAEYFHCLNPNKVLQIIEYIKNNCVDIGD
jgi:hypothetical protein